MERKVHHVLQVAHFALQGPARARVLEVQRVQLCERVDAVRDRGLVEVGEVAADVVGRPLGVQVQDLELADLAGAGKMARVHGSACRMGDVLMCCCPARHAMCARLNGCVLCTRCADSPDRIRDAATQVVARQVDRVHTPSGVARETVPHAYTVLAVQPCETARRTISVVLRRDTVCRSQWVFLTHLSECMDAAIAARPAQSSGWSVERHADSASVESTAHATMDPISFITKERWQSKLRPTLRLQRPHMPWPLRK